MVARQYWEKQGNFDGDEVLDILLEQKQTASYITQKIYQFFVNEKQMTQKIEWLADRFYKNDYDIPDSWKIFLPAIGFMRKKILALK